ncbi:hypothetical protein [Paenibacillus popilliae]|uniref:hypothetical protein n=1 Tax=Paenibacillus popilliae TaxID=78057 RepID=UPI003F5741A7
MVRRYTLAPQTASFERTYEELKLLALQLVQAIFSRFERTYEELKFRPACPMFGKWELRFERTYEELK